MSTTDDARLDAIDRRGRAAARTLLDDLGARPDETVHQLRRTPVPAKRPARRRLLAAAVVVVLAAAGGVAIATRDDHANVSSGGNEGGRILLPNWLPAGFEPASATDLPDPTRSDVSADIAVYGDPDADDPWSAIVVVTHLVADPELLDAPLPEGEAVTVAGHDARLRESDDFGIAGLSPGWQVEWKVDDGRMTVAGNGDSDQVLAAAQAATTAPAIEASGLPDGYEELASGPLDNWLLNSSLFEGDVDRSGEGSIDSGLVVTYADPSATQGVRPAVVVVNRPGPASAVDLLRLGLGEGDETSVRGHHAAIGRGRELPGSAGQDGVVAVQWAESEGQIVTVVGYGVDEDAVLHVADDLRPATAEEIAGLIDTGTGGSREFADVADGQVVVASGTSTTGQWRIVADAERDENIGALTIDRMSGAIGSTTSTTGDRVEPPLDLGADFSDGTAVVWGVLYVDAATVTVEAPGVDPVRLDTYEVDGWDHPVVAGSFPDDNFATADGVVVVARDANGNEVGRNETVLGSGD